MDDRRLSMTNVWTSLRRSSGTMRKPSITFSVMRGRLGIWIGQISRTRSDDSKGPRLSPCPF